MAGGKHHYFLLFFSVWELEVWRRISAGFVFLQQKKPSDIQLNHHLQEYCSTGTNFFTSYLEKVYGTGQCEQITDK
jgi:predicted oxidoreductase